MTHRYLIGLGSNQRSRFGGPLQSLDHALTVLEGQGCRCLWVSPPMVTPPLRRFAQTAMRDFTNRVAMIETAASPRAMLTLAKATEHAFGRRPGARWHSRPLDIDLLFWSGGSYDDGALTIPHPGAMERSFVLHPLRTLTDPPAWAPQPRSIRRAIARMVD